MLREKSVQYDRPDGTGIGADADADADAGEWTGEKRRKHLASSLHCEVPTSSSDSHPQQDHVFTEDDPASIADLMFISSLILDKPYISVNPRRLLDDGPQRRVYERLMLYRLKAHKLSKGESGDKLDDEILKKELPDFIVKEHYMPQLHFEVRKYFECLEEDECGSVDWYFDPKFSKLEHLGNYQRLVLKNHDDVEYFDLEGYRSNFTTYKMDEAYVKFFTEMSGKLQWLKKYIGIKGSTEWVKKTEIRGVYQSLKIARGFPDVTVDLVYTAYKEHVWSLRYDYLHCEEWDTIFLEIWKLVTKQKKDFIYALLEVKERHWFPQHDATMLLFLRNRRLLDLESKFDYCVRDIHPGAGDEVAKEVIKNAVWKFPRKKLLHQYMERKMSIAEQIGLNKDCSEPQILPWDGPKSSHVYV